MKSPSHPPRFLSVNDYIQSQPEHLRRVLEEIRESIKEIVPEAEEVISYQMPAFHYYGMLVYFAIFKKHYSLFFHPAHLDHFRAALGTYKTSKSAINIPLGAPLPTDLLKRMVKYAAKANRESYLEKRKKKS